MRRRTLRARLVGAYSGLVQNLRDRLQGVARRAIKRDVDHNQAMKAYRRTKRCGDRRQWRRWYRANLKHQRCMRAYRQSGGRNPPGMPTSLKREWVR